MRNTLRALRLKKMKATINNFKIDLSKPIDISLPLSNTDANPIAWYIQKPVIEPVTFENWVGKVSMDIWLQYVN